MAHVHDDDLVEPELVCTAASLRQAKKVEHLLTSRGVDYAVQVEEIGQTLLFRSIRHGAAFYVSAAQADYARGVLLEAGHVPRTKGS